VSFFSKIKMLIQRIPVFFALDSRWTYVHHDVLSKFYSTPISNESASAVLKMCGMEEIISQKSMRVLDFGCGHGRYMDVFASALTTNNVYGVDVNGPYVENAYKRGYKNLALLSPIVSALPFATNSFDVVFSSNVIEHIPYSLYLGYLKEIFRVLKPGGKFAVGAPNYPIKRLYDMRTAWQHRHDDLYKYFLFDDPTHCNRQSILQVERHLRKVGFGDIQILPSYFLFEERVAFLRMPTVRHNLRILGNKYFGYCIKPNAQ
jgi:SAM-dependent methyltransferase